MFTKLEECSWIKVGVAWGCNMKDCWQGPHEKCSIETMPYWMVAWWLSYFAMAMIG
jgi:hypothetical protein